MSTVVFAVFLPQRQGKHCSGASQATSCETWGCIWLILNRNCTGPCCLPLGSFQQHYAFCAVYLEAVIRTSRSHQQIDCNPSALSKRKRWPERQRVQGEAAKHFYIFITDLIEAFTRITVMMLCKRQKENSYCFLAGTMRCSKTKHMPIQILYCHKRCSVTG